MPADVMVLQNSSVDDEHSMDTPDLKKEATSTSQDQSYLHDHKQHANSAFSQKSPSFSHQNFAGGAVKDSHETFNSSKLLGNNSLVHQGHTALR